LQFHLFTVVDLKMKERIFKEEAQHKCDYCEKTFEAITTLSIHVRTHGGEEVQFKCNVCDKAFENNPALKRHMKRHSGVKPFTCNLCAKAFAVKRGLESHTKVHTGEKPFKCRLCPKACGTKQHLIIHTRIHTGEKPFKCSLCDKTFAAKQSLAIHTKNHTGAKPYKCNFCRKAFTGSDGLRKHSKTHSKKNLHSIELSNMRFAHLDDHNYHVNSVQKPYKCLRSLFQGAVLNMTGRFYEHVSYQSSTTCEQICFDEKQLGKTEKLRNASSAQSINQSLHIDHICRHQSLIAAHINTFVVRAYGCGLCDEMFEIEKEFMEHCCGH